MKGATLRQRPLCGVASRRPVPVPLRIGICARVIVPSKDNASESSDKRLPLLWTFPDFSSNGVLEKSYVDDLEEVYGREAPEPDYGGATQSLDGQAVEQPASRVQSNDPEDFDPAVLEERLASASLASTSTASASSADRCHAGAQQGRSRLAAAAVAATAPAASVGLGNSGASLSNARSASSRVGLLVSERLDVDVVVTAEEPISSGYRCAAQNSTSGGYGGREVSRTGSGFSLAAARQHTACGTGSEGGSSSSGGSTSAHANGRHLTGHHGHPGSNGHQGLNGHVNGCVNGHTNGHVNGHVNGHSNGHHVADPNGTVVAAGVEEQLAGAYEAASAAAEQQPARSPLRTRTPQLPGALSSVLGPPEGLLLTKEIDDEEEAMAADSRSITSSTPRLLNGSRVEVDAAAVAAAAASAVNADELQRQQQYQPQQAAAADGGADSSIPGSIWILCCISAALTCASCVFNTALPIYMVSELKMSMRSMGMFEGLLEAFSYVVRMCSGVVSDRMTSRKAAITLGFAAGAAAKFGMASAGTVGLLFAGKAVDRLANGIQAAPRDALIGDLSPPGVRSACFGLAQSLRKWGSAVGALAAFFLMKASNNNYQLIFYSASMVSLTACIAFVLLVPAHKRVPHPQPQQQQQTTAHTAHHQQQHLQQAQVRHHVHPSSTQQQQEAHPQGPKPAAAATAGPFSGLREFIRSLGAMGTDFYRMLGVICCYALGHINESLLEARAMEVGFGKAEATLVVAAIAAVTFLTAFPLGKLDDKYGAGTTFAVGIGSLIAGDLVLLLSGPHPMALFAACLFLGVHWAVIQGPLLSIVAGLAPSHLRGTAFGIFYTVMAVTAVAANTMYGSIWHTYGANAAFATSAALMSVVLAALPHMLPASSRRKGPGAAAAPAAPAVPAAAGSVGLPGAAADSGRGGSSLVGSPLPAAA